MVISTVPFALDLNEIGLPLTVSSSLSLSVVNPKSEKSSGDFGLKESFLLF